MNFNDFLQSKFFKVIIFVLMIIVIFLLGFKAGTLVGFRKADFAQKWGDNYHRNFAGPRDGFIQKFKDSNFMEASGIFGQIIKIETNSLVIRGRDDVEKIVIVDDKTTIKFFQDNINLEKLNVDDAVVVIGEPNNAGQIAAKLIRVMPDPKMMNNQNNQGIPTPESSIPHR